MVKGEQTLKQKFFWFVNCTAACGGDNPRGNFPPRLRQKFSCYITWSDGKFAVHLQRNPSERKKHRN